eukprot:m.137572 g.137572  ORF g.137572 m.137572 type:complete len:382 (-) comp23998_c0_seq1:30-1175(-)
MALRSLNVIELAGLAPAPFAGMILSDFGATVTRVDKPVPVTVDTMARGKRSIAIDLKQPAGVKILHRLCGKADVLIEPFRPGVMERLGLGPQVLCKENPGLIYARLTGFGQTGELKNEAGHDINYLAISGLLSTLGRQNENPIPPINIAGDFAGGGMLCVMGILLAVIERSISGKGQVVDAAMVDGAAYLSTFLYTSRKLGLWQGPRGTNLLDTGAPFYETYRTKDGKYMAVGAIEPQFFRSLLSVLKVDHSTINQQDRSAWPSVKKQFAGIFATKEQSEWTRLFEGTDACVTPVVDLEDAPLHPHNRSRSNFIGPDSEDPQPAPAPKLSRTPAATPDLTPITVGQHSREILQELQLDSTTIDDLFSNGTVSDFSEINSKL